MPFGVCAARMNTLLNKGFGFKGALFTCYVHLQQLTFFEPSQNGRAGTRFINVFLTKGSCGLVLAAGAILAGKIFGVSQQSHFQ
jgi:hypothetical protein